MKKNDKKEMDRRTLLSLLGGAGGSLAVQSPIALLLQSIVDGFAYKAHAADLEAKNYFAINQRGAPPRWCYDLFLNPHGNKGFARNPGMGNVYTAKNGVYTGTAYKTAKIEGIHVPWSWKYAVPKAGGGTRPMADLLTSGLFLKGINTFNPDHAGATALHMRPGGASQSLNALSADYGNAKIPAIVYRSSVYEFMSNRNKSYIKVPTKGNALSNLMLPFNGKLYGDFKHYYSAAHDAAEEAAKAIDEMKRFQHPLAEAVAVNQDGARELMNDSISDLSKRWKGLYQKYLGLIHKCFHQKIPGINDRPIGVAPNSRNNTYRLASGTGVVLLNPDLRTLITRNTLVVNMAEVFALAEYAFSEEVTRSVSVGIGGLAELNGVYDGGVATRSTPDEHYGGMMVSTLINTLAGRAYAACVLEFIDQMKAAGKWKDMVIDSSGEFNRYPATNGAGSGHLWQGKSAALYSGSFKGPVCLGNMKVNPVIGKSDGFGAPVKELGAPIGLDDMASTIAYCLGVPSPVTSKQTLVTIDSSGKIRPLIEKTRLVT